MNTTISLTSRNETTSEYNSTGNTTISHVWQKSQNEDCLTPILQRNEFSVATEDTEAEISDNKMEVGTALGIVIGVVTFVFLAGLIIYCLRKRGKLKCCEDCLEKCIQQHRKRKKSLKSFNASNDCLTQEDEEDKIDTRSGQGLETLSAPKLARELFSIGDHDNDITSTRKRHHSDDAADDGYFYDEIFETSAFVDERTNRSIKNLTEDDNFEDDIIPDIIFRATS